MKARDHAAVAALEDAIRDFDRTVHLLPGISDSRYLRAFVEQVIESIRRVDFVRVVASRPISPRRTDPADDLFDPVRASLIHKQCGNVDEAAWLVFLSVHFGKHIKYGWHLTRRVYGRLGAAPSFTWPVVRDDVATFRAWLAAHEDELRDGTPPARFGNHRKYQSLSARSPTGTGAAVASYVGWIQAVGSHQELFDGAVAQAGGGGAAAFDHLFRSMSAVASFGRTARFDYLTMIGKIGIASVEPGSTYMGGATGPFEGAKLLFGPGAQGKSRSELDALAVRLGQHLGIGMQVMEDALCNWQKSPAAFKPFRG